MIPRSYMEWLSVVRTMREDELPTNRSTIGFAVKVAVALADENAELRAAVESAREPSVT